MRMQGSSRWTGRGCRCSGAGRSRNLAAASPASLLDGRPQARFKRAVTRPSDCPVEAPRLQLGCAFASAKCTLQKQIPMSEALRLVFPQWQGADFSVLSSYVPELPCAEAARGYHLGSQLLSWLAPRTDAPTETVPVSLDLDDTATENGIFAYQAVRRQLQDALDIIRRRMPRKITTLGGECSVSVAPFSHLLT